jgi:hypothetical protein
MSWHLLPQLMVFAIQIELLAGSAAMLAAQTPLGMGIVARWCVTRSTRSTTGPAAAQIALNAITTSCGWPGKPSGWPVAPVFASIGVSVAPRCGGCLPAPILAPEARCVQGARR